MLNKSVMNFIGCDAGYEEADIVLYGAPFDSTTSFRPGTRFAGQAVRNDSYGLETYSPYQDRDLEDCRIFDLGDLELAIGDSELVLSEIEKTAETILKDKKLPFMIGGEHLVDAGSRACGGQAVSGASYHPSGRSHRSERGLSWGKAVPRGRYQTVLGYSGDARIHQFGIRSGEKSEFDWARSGHTDFHPFTLDDLPGILPELKGKPVYFTVDLDVLDPSVFPGTGTPEPGGVDFLTLMKNVTEVCNSLNIIGCDVNELCPPCDHSGMSTAVACKIIREMLLALKK